jgi:hypothetical protein
MAVVLGRRFDQVIRNRVGIQGERKVATFTTQGTERWSAVLQRSDMPATQLAGRYIHAVPVVGVKYQKGTLAIRRGVEGDWSDRRDISSAI